jgi:hypothetical protein
MAIVVLRQDEHVKSVERQQTSVLPSDSRCGLCGAGLLLVASRRVRRGLAWLNPLWDPVPMTHEVCPSCGARMEVH